MNYTISCKKFMNYTKPKHNFKEGNPRYDYRFVTRHSVYTDEWAAQWDGI